MTCLRTGILIAEETYYLIVRRAVSPRKKGPRSPTVPTKSNAHIAGKEDEEPN